MNCPRIMIKSIKVPTLKEIERHNRSKKTVKHCEKFEWNELFGLIGKATFILLVAYFIKEYKCYEGYFGLVGF